jgi:hypothetical protein
MKHPATIFTAPLHVFRPLMAVIFGVLALAWVETANGQTLSPPHDTSTLPPVKAEEDGVGLIASAAARGVEHAYRAVMPEASGADVLNGLREGQTVAVHYRQGGEQGGGEQTALVGNEGLDATEGTVTNVNPRQGEVCVRFDTRTTETFRIAPHDVGLARRDASHVLIYYPNAAGEKVPHTFVRVSQARSPRAH